MHEKPTVLSGTEARQGSSRKLNLRVLIMSLLLTVIVGGLLYAVFYNRAGQGAGQGQATPQSRIQDQG